MSKILFIGSFLSKHQGTVGISESISVDLRSNGLQVILSSNKKNKYLRLLEIIFSSFFGSYNQVHIDVFSGASFRIVEIASKIARFRGKKIILTLHGGMLPELYKKNNQKVNKVFKRAHILSTPSLYLQAFFNQNGFEVNYLPNSINLAQFPYNGQLISNYRMLWVRAFSDIYCPEIAIETLLLLKKQFPAITLTMIGPDKGKLSSIKLLIDKYKLSTSVFITGAIPNDELYNYYQNHSVFLNTTTYESFGVCLAEAASCGIPIVTNNVGEIPFLWKNEISACLVDYNNPQMYAKHISRIFTNSDFVTQLKENARKEVEKFDRKSIIEQWLKLLR
jgi:glycosyltransferase involved in cell wall biosynthesis